MSETTQSIAQWQNETFGPARIDPNRIARSWRRIDMAMHGALRAANCEPNNPRHKLSRAIRAAEELAELIELLVENDDDPKACSEVADIAIVLAGIPAVHGHKQSDDIDAKMAINRARKWAMTGDGHGQHVKEP